MKTPGEYNGEHKEISKCVQCGKIISEEDFDDPIFKDDHSLNGL